MILQVIFFQEINISAFINFDIGFSFFINIFLQYNYLFLVKDIRASEFYLLVRYNLDIRVFYICSLNILNYQVYRINLY